MQVRRSLAPPALAGAIAVVLLLGLIAPAAWAHEDHEPEFIATYRCEVLGTLVKLYKLADPVQMDHRYLIVAPLGMPQGYVQCIFIEKGTRMLCEASSGYYANKPNDPRTAWLPGDAKAKLAVLGFDTAETQGNYQVLLPTPDQSKLDAIADLMLRALYQAYGARTEMRMEIQAPQAGVNRAVMKSCQAIS